MKPFTKVVGRVLPLDRSNVDTDQIIPAKHLKRIERTGYGPFAFEAWRTDPDFVLNNPEYQGAPIMVTRSNFGTGSSREHAVWALNGLGLEVLIGESFADIFKSNCVQSCVLTIELPSDDVDYLMTLVQSQPETELEVDLEAQTVKVHDGAWQREFWIEPDRKHLLVNGLDNIGLTLECETDIAAFEANRDPLLPVTVGAGSTNVVFRPRNDQ